MKLNLNRKPGEMDVSVFIRRVRVLIDILSVKPPETEVAVPRANYGIVVGEFTHFKVSQFLQRKDQLAEATCKLFKDWRD